MAADAGVSLGVVVAGFVNQPHRKNNGLTRLQVSLS